MARVIFFVEYPFFIFCRNLLGLSAFSDVFLIERSGKNSGLFNLLVTKRTKNDEEHRP